MTYTQIISIFEKMFYDKWGYVLGTAGVKWTEKKAQETGKGKKWVGHMVADCSGAFVYALKKGNINIYHGSNRIAREHVEKILPIDKWEPGMIAFKSKSPGQEGYNLPADYKLGGTHYNGDLKDYYHCGLLDHDGSVINLQSSSTGCVLSTRFENWLWCARLKGVEYSNVERPVSISYELGRKLYEELSGYYEK